MQALLGAVLEVLTKAFHEVMEVAVEDAAGVTMN